MTPPQHPTGPTSPAGPADAGTAPTAPCVVVVDDDPDQRDLMCVVLARAGFGVETAASGEQALELIRRLDPDLVTLDLSLPGIDGIETCRRLRGFSDAYVIMVTSRSAELDRLLGLEVGADDYLVKPCSPRELVARASALLRRPRRGLTHPAPTQPDVPAGPVPPAAVVDAGGGLLLHPVRHVALLDGAPLPLTPSEVDLLWVLTRKPVRTWWRAELVGEVWQGDFMESDFLVDVHVASLRRKLRRAGPDRTWIQTVDGSGYRFVDS